MKKMKKVLIVALSAALFGTALAGCSSSDGGTSSSSSSSSSETPEESTESHTLTISAWDSSFNIPAIEAAGADYKENVDPDFELVINETSGSSDIEDAITLCATSGNYSTLTDIVLFQDHYIQRFISDYPDAWIPLDDAEETYGVDWSSFMEEKLSYSTVNGVHYGMPVDNGTVVAAYRTDLLEEAGYTIEDLTGCTWDTFMEIGEAVYALSGKYLLSMASDGNDLVYMMLQAEGQSQFEDGVPNFVNNETLIRIIEIIDEMQERNVLYIANSWTDYTDQTIVGDMVAGVINGNWILATMELAEENTGKWQITSMPTLDGGEGYAANGGASLYITANCENTELAKAFLCYTFGGSTQTYDNALLDGGVVTTYLPAAESEVYSEGVDFYGGQAVYAKIAEMSENVPIIEQSDYHFTARDKLAAAIINIRNGADVMSELQDAEDQLNFEMGN